MASWKKLIIGDAFRLPSRDLNYYRDCLLAWPFFLFTIAAVVNLLRRGADHREGIEFAGLASLALLLARERFILMAAALGLCVVLPLLAFFLRHEATGLLVAIIAGVLFLLLITSLRNYKFSYELPKYQGMVDLIVGLISLGIALLIFRWIAV